MPASTNKSQHDELGDRLRKNDDIDLTASRFVGEHVAAMQSVAVRMEELALADASVQFVLVVPRGCSLDTASHALKEA